MSGWNLRSLAPALVFIASALPAAASGPIGPGSSTPDLRPPIDNREGQPEFQSLGISRPFSIFQGVVLDINDHPVPNVQVKLFVDGEMVASALTDGNGAYDLRAIYDYAADNTALMWYVAPDRSLMSKEVVLRESKESRANQLISRCIPRASYTPGRQFRVYLFDPANRNKELSELDCLS